MKIVIINGQNHKGSTYHIGRILADQLAAEDDIREFFLPRDLNHFCLGCYQCMNDLAKCPYAGDKQILADAMEEADLIIMTSPNYCFMPSAPLKAFIDLFYQYWIPHRPQASMFHKKAVVISTAAGAGAGNVCKQLKRTLAYWGIPFIKTYAIAVQASKWADVSEKKKDKIEKDMKKMADQIRSCDPGKPSLFIRMMFLMMRANKKKWQDSEANHWRENGWLDEKRPWK